MSYCPDYVVDQDLDTGDFLAIRCKGCGQVIKAKDARGVMRANAAYAEINIEMEDGSHHVTPVCIGCVEAACDSPKLLCRFMQDDGRQLAAESERAGIEFDLKSWFKRTPISAVRSL